jgi:hypothetical protein
MLDLLAHLVAALVQVLVEWWVIFRKLTRRWFGR